MKNFVDYTNLKRSKRSFQTTAHQTLQETRTISRSVLKPQSFQKDITLNINPTLNINNQRIKYQKESLDTRFLFERVAAYIFQDQNCIKREAGCKFIRHFYSKTIPRTIKHPLMNVPEIVSKTYSRQCQKRQRPSGPPVAMSQGYLKTINCVYYAVQNTLIFIKIQDLLNNHQTEKVPYIIQQVRNQVINIVQIVKQNKLFPSHQIVLCIIHPWQIQFYAWQSDVVLKNKNRIMHNQVQMSFKQPYLKALNYIFALPLEKVKAIGLSQDGRLFFFDQQGALNQIVPQQQTKFLICKTGRHKIRNFINSSQNTFQLLSNRHGKYSSIFNLVSNISQITKYLFPSSIQAEVIFCDNKRSLLFGLLRKNIKLLFGNENKLFIVCYDIKSKAKLIHKFSQEYFIQKYAVNIENESLANFAIKTIAPAPDSTQNTNLIIITKSGIKILVKIIPNEVKIIQIIRPPDYRMFDTQIDFLNKTNLQYVPQQKNQYNLCSFLSDQNRTISTLTKDKGFIFTYISINVGVSSTIDANLQINCVDLQIYKAGSWNVEIYKINQNLASHNTQYYQSLYTGGDGKISQLSSQTISSPSYYLFLSTNKLQLLTYLRPVDVVFTTLLLSSKQPQIRKTFPGQLIPKQKLLIKLFIMPQQQYSIVGPHKLTFEQLSAMILQILVDQNGVYFYSKQLATELIKIWVLFSAKEDTSKLDDKNFQRHGKLKSQINVRYQYDAEFQNNNQFNQQYNRRHGIKIQSTVQNQIVPYQKIHQKNKYEARQILQYMSIFSTKVGPITSNSYQIFYQLPSNQPSQPASKSSIIKFKLAAILRYLSLLLSSLWRLKLNQIDQRKNQIQCMQIKLQGLHKYLKQLKQSIFLYDSLKGNQSIQVEIQQLLKVIQRVKQFLMLIENVKIMNKNIRFGEYLLQDNQGLEQSIFWTIHREFKYFIINKWKSLFPTFISNQFHKLIILYGQLQQITNKKQIINQLKKQPHIKILPQYFINYLKQIRGFNQQDVKQLLNTKQLLTNLTKQQSKGDLMNDWDDFNFQMPNNIKEIVSKYSRVSQQINQNDLQVIIEVLTSNKNIQTKLTIANKQAIISFIQNNSILHPKLQFLAKFISIQYELYRFYLNMFTLQPRLKFNLPFLKAKEEQQTKNQQTILLLKYNTIIDADMLKKLVFATNHLWMMTNFCMCFYELADFRTVFKSVCQDYNNEKSNKYSNFAAYIQRYMLNFALKTKFDDQILKIACRVIDEYMQSQVSTRKIIKNWVRFNSLTSITDKLIWLPNITIKIGYKPENLFKIYLSQLQMSFNNSVLLQNQILYCIQFLTCYTIAKQYPNKHNIQFGKSIILHLDSLERNKAIDQSTKKGIKKMIDELLC